MAKLKVYRINFLRWQCLLSLTPDILEVGFMYKIIVVITTALIGLTSSIALPAQFLAPA